jgi:hypothetical protein
MISYTTISHMQGITEAMADNELHLGAARLATTGKRVAVVVESAEIEHGLVATTPLALLNPTAEPFVDADGSLTDEARRVFKTLKAKILKPDYETWFNQDADGHVQVSFAKRGAPADPHKALITLPWDDPDDMFQETMIDG